MSRIAFPSEHGDMWSVTCHNVYCMTKNKLIKLIVNSRGSLQTFAAQSHHFWSDESVPPLFVRWCYNNGITPVNTHESCHKNWAAPSLHGNDINKNKTSTESSSVLSLKMFLKSQVKPIWGFSLSGWVSALSSYRHVPWTVDVLSLQRESDASACAPAKSSLVATILNVCLL